MPPLFLALASIVGGCTAQPPRDDAFSATGQMVALSGGDGGPTHACVSCHGLRGEGDGRDAPRLAGLDRGYLERQLDDYATGRRDHAAMRTIARRLSGPARGRVASYYAALTPPPAAGASGVLASDLYLRGDTARGLAPCASCHGVNGEGGGPANPPLAGQPPAYLASQLHAWREGRRYNDPLGKMREISRRLSEAEVAALARYAAGLRPRLEDPVASPATRRADPRNDASARHPHAAGS